MAKPGQDVQAPRSASHGAVQLNSHPYKNPDGNLGKPKFIRIFLAKAEYCAIPLSLADRAYGGRLRMKGHDPSASAFQIQPQTRARKDGEFPYFDRP
jgi:hypothetical protein